MLRVLPDPEAKQRLERVYEALGREINRLFPDSVVRLTLAGDKVVVTGQAKDIVEAAQILQIVGANATGQARTQGLLPGQGPAGAIPLTQVATSGLNLATGGLSTISQTFPGVAGSELPTLANYQLAVGANVINLLRVPGEQQVMLKVTVAEVDRAASRTVGVDFSVLNRHGGTVFASHLSNQPLPTGGQGNTNGGATPVGSNNITAVLDNGRIVSTITALRTLNFARTLAEPNLVTTNGQSASFLAGGEFPVPVTSGITLTGLQGVQFVPFGVQLRFIPYVTDKDRVRLVVSSNVTTRDPASAATIGGATVSGLNSRFFQTTVELRDGQTIAVAGLIQNSYGATAVRVPFIGDLPIVGRLFAQDGSSSNEQELVVLITPMLVHPYDPHQVPPLPGSDIFEPGDLEFYLLGRLESRRSYPMFGVARRNPLRCKGRIFDSSLHHGFFPLGWRGRALVDELQRLQDQPRVGTAAGHPTTFRLSLQAEGHQPNRRQRVHRPRRRQINTRLFESSAEKSLDQQGQRRDKNVRLDSRLDLVIDRPHRHYVLQLPKSALDVGQFLVQRHGVEDAQSLLAGRDHVFPLEPLLALEVRLALGEFKRPAGEFPVEISIAVISLHDAFDGRPDLLGPLQVAGGDTLLELLQFLTCSLHRLLTLRLFVAAPLVGVDDDHAHVGISGGDFLGARAGRVGLPFPSVDAAGTVNPLGFVDGVEPGIELGVASPLDPDEESMLVFRD